MARCPTMKSASRRQAWLAALLLLALLLPVGGCAEPRHDIVVDVRVVVPGARPPIPSPNGLKVAVAPFTIERLDKIQVGSLAPLLGENTRLIVNGEDLGQDVAEVFVDELKRRLGWRAWLDKPGIEPLEGGPDIKVSGLLRQCVATAESGVFGTTVLIEVDLAVEVLNAADGSRLRLDLSGRRSQWIGDFEAREVEELLNETIRQTIAHFVAATEVEGRRLIRKEPGVS